MGRKGEKHTGAGAASREEGRTGSGAGMFQGLLLGGDDLPALVRALLLGLGRDPALALAAVLAAAAVAATRARAVALARVDAGTLHVAPGLVVAGSLVSGVGSGGEHCADGRGDEGALQVLSVHV